MSGYQYYEFCKINEPLSQEARKEMASLSSRAKVNTHGVSYVYNYGDFRGDPKKLLLKHFDVFFYISNWGTVRLMFKYDAPHIDIDEIKKHCIKHIISCETKDTHVVIDIHLSNEEGFGWTEGEGLLLDLLPLYNEIKDKSYNIFHLASAINDELTGKQGSSLHKAISKIKILSSVQQAFLESMQLDYKAT